MALPWLCGSVDWSAVPCQGIPGQGTCLGHSSGRQFLSHIDVSLSLSPPKSIKMYPLVRI